MLEGEGVAVLGVDEHVDGEKEGIGGSVAVVVGDELGDGDDAAGGEGIETFCRRWRDLAAPSLWRMWPRVAMWNPLPKSTV